MTKEEVETKWEALSKVQDEWNTIEVMAVEIMSLTSPDTSSVDEVSKVTVSEGSVIIWTDDGYDRGFGQEEIPIDIFCQEPEIAAAYIKAEWAKQKIEREEKWKKEAIEKDMKTFEELRKKLNK